MDEANDKVAGSWKFLRILGSGGFGQVSLWYDSYTGQKIAIKKLLESALEDAPIRSKLIERWCNEVEIMKKLNHANIVGTLNIPEELKQAEPLPVLAMEYCSNGDLRQVLNKPENCCGLCEPEIINILRDISNGLAYLHSCKIIHRDIKPDNIVLQQKGKAIIYKLIDLGYAKALDQNSLSRSFVGTIQYIAPELFMGKEYTSSVDYWSFGLTAHEIMTGYRPFLHGFSPSDWMKQIQDKSRSVIWVAEGANGEITFSQEISKKNHLSRCFLKDIEDWLQLALDWDGQTRGRDVEKNRLVIFERLTEIICKKLIKVFSMPTYDVLSYEVTNETDISDLRIWLKKDTKVEEEDQLLILPNGKSLNKKGNLFKNIDIERLDRFKVSLFLYSSNTFSPDIDTALTQDFVGDLRKLAKNHLSYRQLKRFCADSVYFLQSQAIRYRNFLQGIKIKIINTKQTTLAIERFYEDLEDEWSRVENYGSFLSFSHKTDLESYIYYRKAGKLKSSPLVQKWIEHAVNINSKISELNNSFNKTKQRQLVLLAKQRCRNLDDHSNEGMIQLTPLDSLVEKGQNLWENMQRLSKYDREILTTGENVVALIDKSIEETHRFFKSEMLKTLLMKISEADGNLTKFRFHLSSIYKSMNMLKLIIQHVQTERQKDVWSLIESARSFKDENNEKETTVENEDSDALKGILRNGDPVMIEKQASFGSDFVDVVPLSDLLSASSVIEDNNHLRYRIQEVQQMCSQMCTEMRSLNWDFLSEF